MNTLNYPLNSVSIFVGTGRCNANCNHCAGLPLRKYAPKEDGVLNEALIERTLRACYEKGARSLSISSSGEPTLSPKSVTRVLEIAHGMRKEGINYQRASLYSNGIRIGEEENFSREYLSLWKELELKTVYVTVHDIDETRNAQIYGVKSYPSLELVVSRIHDAGMSMRANLVLSKNTICTAKKFIHTVKYLRKIGVDEVSAWPIRNMQDEVDRSLSPIKSELDLMEKEISAMDFRVRL